MACVTQTWPIVTQTWPIDPSYSSSSASIQRLSAPPLLPPPSGRLSHLTCGESPGTPLFHYFSVECLRDCSPRLTISPDATLLRSFFTSIEPGSGGTRWENGERGRGSPVRVRACEERLHCALARASWNRRWRFPLAGFRGLSAEGEREWGEEKRCVPCS